MKAFFVSLVLLVSSWVLVVSLLNPKNVKCFISKSSSNRNINSLQMSSFSSLINNHKRIFNPILIPLVGISISLFGSASNAAIFNDPYFQVTFPDSFVVSPKPLKTHEREFLAKSEVSKGYNFGVTVRQTNE